MELKGDDRISCDVLTKYEMCNIISLRTTQIANGSAVYVKVPASMKVEGNAMEVAELELRERKTPLLLKRTHANGDY